jgi:hypothetical protein
MSVLGAAVAEGWTYLAAFVEHTLLEPQRLIVDIIQRDKVGPRVTATGREVCKWALANAVCALLRANGVIFER